MENYQYTLVYAYFTMLQQLMKLVSVKQKCVKIVNAKLGWV
jgi:hypothetical protein